MLELAPQVHGVTDAKYVQPRVRSEIGHLIHAVPLLAERVYLLRLEEIGPGIQLHQIGHRLVVTSVAGDEAQLSGETTDLCLGGDLEQVLRVGVIGGDAFTIEIVVEMLYLLVAGEEHQMPGVPGDGQVVAQVNVPGLRRDVRRHQDVLGADTVHLSLLLLPSAPGGENGPTFGGADPSSRGTGFCRSPAHPTLKR